MTGPMSHAAERTGYVTEQCLGIMKEVKSGSVQSLIRVPLFAAP